MLWLTGRALTVAAWLLWVNCCQPDPLQAHCKVSKEGCFQTPAASAIVLNACTFSSNCPLAPHVPAHHSSQGQLHCSLIIIVLIMTHHLPRPSQVISTARTCDLIIIVLDCLKPLTHKRIIERELEGFGIRLNKTPPNITFK